jgi:uncharacterized Zn finger protein (UPF0148 family)
MENCPKCGAPWQYTGRLGCVFFQCQTVVRPNGEVDQTDHCKLTALTQRAEQAERERGELKAAAWCLDKPDDASHQETLDMIDELWNKKVAPITSLLDQSRALTAAEAEVKRLREGIERAKNEVHAIRRIGISAGYMGFSGDWIASQCDSILKALLAQPSDDQPGPNSQPTHK